MEGLVRSLTPECTRRGIGLCCTDPSGSIVWANERAAALLGTEVEALPGVRMEAALAAADVYLLDKDVPGRAQVKAESKERRGFLQALPLALEPGQTLWLLWGLEGLYELLRESFALFDYVRDGVVIADGQGVMVDLNRAAEDFGIQRWEIGKTVAEIMGSGTFTGSAIQQVVELGQPATSLVQRNHRSAISSAYPVFDRAGRLWRIIANIRDVTEIHALRQELEIAKGLSQTFEQELRRKHSMADVVAVSKNIKDVFELAGRLAEVSVPVFIEGESGVGKEVVAKFIHLNSKREGSFVRINCGAIPAQLLESELFGYEAGAFTGAAQRGKAGFIELADRGTLFLDEVTELPLELQVKFLHALQDQEVTRVGGVKPRRFDARIVAATNRNVADMVSKGTFREDLFYRLYVIPVRVPPLRERRSDIPILLAHFVKYYGNRFGVARYLDPGVIHRLTEYDWPGNVRELINLVERLLVTSVGELITEDDLPPHYRQRQADDGVSPSGAAPVEAPLAVAEHTLAPAPGHDPEPLAALEDVLAAHERQYLQQALTRCRTQEEAARALGISLASLARRIRRYGLGTARRSVGT